MPLGNQAICANKCTALPAPISVITKPVTTTEAETTEAETTEAETTEAETESPVTSSFIPSAGSNLDLVFIIEASDNMVVAEWNNVVTFCERIVRLAIHQNYDVNNVVIVARFMKTNSYLQRFVEGKIRELNLKLQAISSSTQLYQHFFESFIEIRKHVMTDVYPYLRQNSKKVLISITDYMYREGDDFNDMDDSIEVTIEIMNHFDVLIAIGVGPAVDEENLIMDANDGKVITENGVKEVGTNYQIMLAAEFEDLTDTDFAQTLFEKIESEPMEPTA